MSEVLNRLNDERNLSEIDHLNRFRNIDGSHNDLALIGVKENLIPGVKEAAMPYAVSTTYQEYRDGTYWWLDQTPEDVAASGYKYHQHPAALDRVAVEVDEAFDVADNLKPGFIKVFISPRMSKNDAPYSVARQEHLGDDDMIRIHSVDTDDWGNPLGKYMQSILVRHVPLSAWVNMLNDPNNIFGKSIDVRDETSALSIMEVHKQLELPEEALPEGVLSLVEAVLPYADEEAQIKISEQLDLFRCDQRDLHCKADNIADRWLKFEMDLADSLYIGSATNGVQDFIRNLAFEWDDSITQEIMDNTLPDNRINMTRSLASKLETSRQNTLWVSGGVITKNSRILAQMTPEAAQRIYVNEMFLQTMIQEGQSDKDIQSVEAQNNKLVAKQNITAGGGCPGSGKGFFNALSSESKKKSNETADKKCPEIKNGQEVPCPGCKKKVRAIVPNHNKIYCSNPNCKLAAPYIKAKPDKSKSVSQVSNREIEAGSDNKIEQDLSPERTKAVAQTALRN